MAWISRRLSAPLSRSRRRSIVWPATCQRDEKGSRLVAKSMARRLADAALDVDQQVFHRRIDPLDVLDDGQHRAVPGHAEELAGQHRDHALADLARRDAGEPVCRQVYVQQMAEERQVVAGLEAGGVQPGDHPGDLLLGVCLPSRAMARFISWTTGNSAMSW